MRLHAAASRLALCCQQLRYRAVTRSTCCGLVFLTDQPADSICYQLVEDGNRNGLRRREIADGTDPALGSACDPSRLHGGVRFGILMGEPVPVLPPGSGSIDNPADPIRFGSSDIVSFTPAGTSSSGTVYLLSPRGRMAAVRLYGVTGRIQQWDYLRARGRWNRR